MEGKHEYEFTEAQNETLDVLSGRMRWVGWFLIMLGGLTAVGVLLGAADSIGDTISYLGGGAVYFLIGLWTVRASGSFTRIVNTKGRDISNLMDGLQELRKLYSLQFWLIMAALALGVIGIVISLLAPGLGS